MTLNNGSKYTNCYLINTGEENISKMPRLKMLIKLQYSGLQNASVKKNCGQFSSPISKVH